MKIWTKLDLQIADITAAEIKQEQSTDQYKYNGNDLD